MENDDNVMEFLLTEQFCKWHNFIYSQIMNRLSF